MRKELIVFTLVYNLVPLVMSEAARWQNVDVDRISFIDGARWLAAAAIDEPLSQLCVDTRRPNRYEPQLDRRPNTNVAILLADAMSCASLLVRGVGPEGLEPPTKGLCLPTTAFAAPFGFVVWTVSSLYEFAVQSLHLPLSRLGSGLAYRPVIHDDTAT